MDGRWMGGNWRKEDAKGKRWVDGAATASHVTLPKVQTKVQTVGMVYHRVWIHIIPCLTSGRVSGVF